VELAEAEVELPESPESSSSPQAAAPRTSPPAAKTAAVFMAAVRVGRRNVVFFTGCISCVSRGSLFLKALHLMCIRNDAVRVMTVT
jgi:hypothetical protein